MNERDGGSETGGGGGDRPAAAAAAASATAASPDRPTLKVHLPNGFHMVKYSESTDVKVSTQRAHQCQGQCCVFGHRGVIAG